MRQHHSFQLLICICVAVSAARAAEPDAPAWAVAHRKPAMTADETRAFIKRLATSVIDNHLKRDERSPQRGMIYEYLDMRRRGQFDQFVQGEALDTMHDGAWFAVAMANAYRATGDDFYKRVLSDWQLPFYLKTLNHSDELFQAPSPDKQQGDADSKAERFNKEHLLQHGEKGFVPYFWDDGGSVSLERRQKKQPVGVFSCVDNFVRRGQDNPRYLLDGYSLGCSNHMAQDLAVMLETSWLIFSQSSDERDQRLSAEIAEAAKNLHESRMKHHGPIPAVVAAFALSNKNEEWQKRIPDPAAESLWKPNNHYTQAVIDFKSDQRYSAPGFADDQEYQYYSALARTGGSIPEPMAFHLIYDAYTEPLLYRAYSDDAEVPPGINGFDLHPYYWKNGKPLDYRSDRKGPFNKPRPIGSRFGPQNMVVCGWALQLLGEYPDVWNVHATQKNLSPAIETATLRKELHQQLAGGLRTWEAIFDQYGYIPTGIGTASDWDHFSDTGGYAHLISAAGQYLILLEGKKDWELGFSSTRNR